MGRADQGELAVLAYVLFEGRKPDPKALAPTMGTTASPSPSETIGAG
jgi:hypothetical protein